MSPIRIGLLILMLISMLTACKSEAEPETKEENNQTTTPTAEQEEKIPDSGEIISNALQIMKSAKNYSVETNMDQYMELEDKKYFDNTYRSQTSVNLDPVRYHEKASIHKTEVQEDKKTNINNIQLERYFTDKGVFIYDSNEGRWVKFPEEFTHDFQTFDKSFEQPERMLELLDDYTENVQVKEGITNYRLTVSGNNAKMQEMALEMMRMVNAEFSSSMEDFLYRGAIKELNFEIDINKDTFHLEKMKMDLAMTLNNKQGRPYESNHTVVTRYSSLNSTEKVVIPSKVLETAEEMELEEFSGFEDMEELDTIDGADLEEYYKDLKEDEANSNPPSSEEVQEKTK